MWLLLAAVTFSSPPQLRNDIVLAAERVHAAEIASKTATAFLSDPERAPPELTFTAHHVGTCYAGPDQDVLGEAAASVHVSTQSVLTYAECMSLRLDAEIALARGFSSDFTYTDLASIDEVNVVDLPIARRILRRKLATLLPQVAERFALDQASLRVCDAVVLRYDAKKRATRQPIHRDEALIVEVQAPCRRRRLAERPGQLAQPRFGRHVDRRSERRRRRRQRVRAHHAGLTVADHDDRQRRRSGPAGTQQQAGGDGAHGAPR